MLICLPSPLCSTLLPIAVGVTCGCASCTNEGRRPGLYLWFSDLNFKPWPSCHCFPYPLSRNEDLLPGEKGDKGDLEVGRQGQRLQKHRLWASKPASPEGRSLPDAWCPGWVM